jgi:hypothetical protein
MPYNVMGSIIKRVMVNLQLLLVSVEMEALNYSRFYKLFPEILERVTKFGSAITIYNYQAYFLCYKLVPFPLNIRRWF